MNEFYALLIENPISFIIILILTTFFYCILFRRYLFSFFDPFTLSIIYSVFATSVVSFMSFYGVINKFHIAHFYMSQFAFFIGFFIFKPFKFPEFNKQNIGFKNDSKIFLILSIISFILYAGSTLISWKSVGIPILQDSRLGIYADSGGLGVLERVISICKPILIIFVIQRFLKKKINLLVLCMFCFLVLESVLSGSRTSLFEIVFISFFYILFSSSQDIYLKNKVKNIQKYFSLIAIIGVVVILMLKISDAITFKYAILAIGSRFLNSGDIFMYSYTTNVLNELHQYSGFYALFKDLFGFTRMIPYNNLPPSLGIEIYKHTHVNPIENIGPNSRHNIFGLFYWGLMGSIVFSFVIGIITSFVRNKLVILLPKKGMLGLTIYTLLYPLANIRVDPTLAVKALTNILFIFIPIFIISTILSSKNETKKKA